MELNNSSELSSFLCPTGTYEEQRKKRLGDILYDYLGDDESSPATFYQDLKSEVADFIQYHEKELGKGKTLLRYLNGDTTL